MECFKSNNSSALDTVSVKEEPWFEEETDAEFLSYSENEKSEMMELSEELRNEDASNSSSVSSLLKRVSEDTRGCNLTKTELRDDFGNGGVEKKMEINVELLIGEIFCRPALWDKKNKNHYNRISVEKQWQGVEDKIRIPKSQLKKRWKSIRDQFRMECKKIPLAKTGATSISEEQCDMYVTWPHFKSLLFLKDHMKARKPIEKISAVRAEDFSLDAEQPKLNTIFNTAISHTKNNDKLDNFETITDIPQKKKFKGSSYETDKILAIEQRKLLLLEKKIKQTERDDDEAFFQSLLPFMKKLSPNRKLRCRMEIQNIVYNYVFPSGKTDSSTSVKGASLSEQYTTSTLHSIT